MNFQEMQQFSRDAEKFQTEFNSLGRKLNEHAKKIALVKVELDFHSQNLSEMAGHYQPVAINELWV